jgi:hypothetical protein
MFTADTPTVAPTPIAPTNGSTSPAIDPGVLTAIITVIGSIIVAGIGWLVSSTRREKTPLATVESIEQTAVLQKAANEGTLVAGILADLQRDRDNAIKTATSWRTKYSLLREGVILHDLNPDDLMREVSTRRGGSHERP